jgi:F-type H+-transporting ATPase subunit delta
MIEGSLGRRYSRALFELAKEGGQEEAIGSEIERFLGLYAGSPLQAVLNNPAFELTSRKKVLTEIVNSLQLSPVSVHFLSLLLERDRLNYLPMINARYRRMLNEAKGRVEAKVTGSSPLEPALLERLRAVLGGISGKEALLHEETDPGLIGGIVLELEGTVYDGSVRTQLQNMKQRIVRGY